jgi:hypothetical protein
MTIKTETQEHHIRYIRTSQQTHKNITTETQEHHNRDTRTLQQRHKNTTTDLQEHHIRQIRNYTLDYERKDPTTQTF